MSLKKVAVIFVEGATDKEFYIQLAAEIRKENGGSLDCDVEIINLAGIGHYKNYALRKFENEIKPKYKEAKISVALCFDTDVFEYGKVPPVNMKKVAKSLKEAGASFVTEVKAVRSIEDWFLYDADGLREFLKLDKKTVIQPHSGTSGLERLFKKAGKTYIKGGKCKGLIESLNMDKIYPHIKGEIDGIYRILCVKKK